MKYDKIKIESDGTIGGTKFFVDGKQIENVERVEFSSDHASNFPIISVHVARVVNGEVKKKKVKVRDLSTQKFFEREEIETEPLLLERK